MSILLMVNMLLVVHIFWINTKILDSRSAHIRFICRGEVAPPERADTSVPSGTSTKEYTLNLDPPNLSVPSKYYPSMSNLYSHREEQNNQRFDQLAQTLQQFRTTVDNDIHGSIQQEMLALDVLNDNLSQLWTKMKRTSGDLRSIMNRNASLTRIVFIILLVFFLLWTVVKLKN